MQSQEPHQFDISGELHGIIPANSVLSPGPLWLFRPAKLIHAGMMLLVWACLGSGFEAIEAAGAADAIVITRQPESVRVPIGSFVRLSVEATGPIEGYAWIDFQGQVISRAGPGPLAALELTTAVGSRPYYVVVTNTSTAVTSATATVRAQVVRPEPTWKGRLPQLVADQTTTVPGFPGLRFQRLSPDRLNDSRPYPIPTLTYRDGKLHFVAQTTANVRGLFRFSDGILQTLVYTNTRANNGVLVGDVIWPADEQNGFVHFTSQKALNRWSENGVEVVADENTALPGASPRFYQFSGPLSAGGNELAFGITSAIFFKNGNNLSLIADSLTDLPGTSTGFGRINFNSGAPYYLSYDGRSLVFSSGGGGRPGFYKAIPGGPITKLADALDVVPGTTNRFLFFDRLDIDGGLAFGIIRPSTGGSMLWAFDDAGGMARVGGTVFLFSAAGPNSVYYATVGPGIRRWSPEADEVVLFATTINGDTFFRISWVDGQGDDLAFVVTDISDRQRIYQFSGPVRGETTPIILVEPWDFNVAEMFPADFAVTAVGARPLSFQWRHGTDDIAGATNGTFSLAVVDAALAGDYTLVITNQFGSVTSQVARLTVHTPSSLLVGSQLHVTSDHYGSDSTLFVRASGPQPLTFQWKTNGVEVPGAKERSYHIPLLNAAARGQYEVQVSDGTTSSTVSLNLTNIRPAILQRPQLVTGAAGSTVSFSVEAIGLPPLTYRWSHIVGNESFGLTNATESTLVLTNISPADAGRYSVLVVSEGIALQSTSAEAALVVNTPAPLLGTPRLSNGRFEFAVPTDIGRTYELQFTPTLSNEAAWSVLQILFGDGTTRVISLPTPAPQGFYRVNQPR